MTNKELILEALKVYTSHCATQIVRKRNLKETRPTREQLKRIEEVRNIWKFKFERAGTALTQIDKGELLGL